MLQEDDDACYQKHGIDNSRVFQGKDIQHCGTLPNAERQTLQVKEIRVEEPIYEFTGVDERSDGVSEHNDSTGINQQCLQYLAEQDEAVESS